jgi:hypothetical protein
MHEQDVRRNGETKKALMHSCTLDGDDEIDGPDANGSAGFDVDGLRHASRKIQLLHSNCVR